MTSCDRENCHAPDTACVLGLDPCPHFTPAGHPEGEAGHAGRGLPWSGLALGSSDLAAVAAVGRVHLVALVGVANAGKTTALAAHWIAARRGHGRFGRTFAGSYTLLGWHQIARHLQWQPFGRGFPPHTSATSNRVPSLLHASYVHDGAPMHFIYADVPGEWYREWAYSEDAVPGATWIADNADAFAILADSESLGGVERGMARGDYETLANRVAAVAQGRPVLPIRTKSDLVIPEGVRDRIEQVNRTLFDAETMCVSMYDQAVPLTDAVDVPTAAAIGRRRAATWTEIDPDERHDVFLRFRTVAGSA